MKTARSGEGGGGGGWPVSEVGEREVSIIKKYFPTLSHSFPFPLVSLYFTQQVDTAQGEIRSTHLREIKRRNIKKMLFSPSLWKWGFSFAGIEKLFSVLCSAFVCGAISAVGLHAKLIFIFLLVFFFLSWKNILLVSIGKRENIYPCSSSNGCAADCAVHSDRTKLNHHDVVTVGNLSLGPAHFLMGVLDSKPFFLRISFFPFNFFSEKEKNINFVWNFSCLFSRKGEKWWRKKHKLIV